MALKPSWAVYHKMGEDLSPHLDPNHTYDEIGYELGCSHQAAYHLTMVALGKLIYGLKRNLSEKRVHN